MGWPTDSGRRLREGDRVVWRGWSTWNKDQTVRSRPAPDMRYQAKVTECLPENDDDNGEVGVRWIGEPPPEACHPAGHKREGQPHSWFHPPVFEHIDDVDATTRLADLGRTPA